FLNALNSLSTAHIQGFSVIQTPPILWKNAGESAEMRCEHQDSSYYQMYWYRQLPGERIQQIVYSDTTGKPDFGEFSKEKYEVHKTIAQNGSFTVKKLEPGDSAMYFCAAGKHSGAELLHSLSKTPPALLHSREKGVVSHKSCRGKHSTRNGEYLIYSRS
ncbi:TVB4 protein, partial [Atractosteus spatula]|nr:TVB4 protein [Atractosteus spatula]